MCCQYPDKLNYSQCNYFKFQFIQTVTSFILRIPFNWRQLHITNELLKIFYKFENAISHNQYIPRNKILFYSINRTKNTNTDQTVEVKLFAKTTLTLNRQNSTEEYCTLSWCFIIHYTWTKTLFRGFWSMFDCRGALAFFLGFFHPSLCVVLL